MPKISNAEEAIIFRPIGGLGQIGSNMMFVSTGKVCFIIDAGILFPYDDSFNINYLIPDFRNLPSKPDFAIFTHGHEDHIGAAPHLFEHFPGIEIFCTPFCAELIQLKTGHGNYDVNVKVVESFQKIETSEIDLYLVSVNHSIPQTCGVLGILKNRKKSFLFLSDFKYDPTSIYEEKFDIERVGELTHGIENKILFIDSTNTFSTAVDNSESGLIPTFEKIISECQGRIFITTFSSNIHRIQAFLKLAKAHNINVIPYGRSMNRYIEAALKNDIIIEDIHCLKEADAVDRSKKAIILLTGCQGDFRGALRRVVFGSDPMFKLGSKDVLVFSSKAIPGNEKKVNLAMNRAAEQGVQVITPYTHHVHVSGHAYLKDIATVIQSFCPKYIIPIHGESVFLAEQYKKLTALFQDAEILSLSNGVECSIFDSDYSINDYEYFDPILIHGNGLPIEKECISERRKVAEAGIVFLFVPIESIVNKRPKFSLDVVGLPSLFESLLRSELEELIFIELKSNRVKILEQRAEELRIFIRRYLGSHLGYRPVVKVRFL